MCCKYIGFGVGCKGAVWRPIFWPPVMQSNIAHARSNQILCAPSASSLHLSLNI